MTHCPVATVHETYQTRYADGAQSDSDESVHECGTITLVKNGGDHPWFNMGFVFEPPTSDDLREAVRWISAQGVPFWLNVADEALPRFEDLAAEHDIGTRDMVLSGMFRPSLDDLPPNESGADIAEVTTEAEVSAFLRVYNTVFDIEKEEHPDQSSGESVHDDRWHAYLGRVDDQIVAIGGAHRSGSVASVFDIGVKEEFRGRGIGTAICSTSLRTAREEGCQVATLESTPIAVSMYETLGFETVVRYHLFEMA